MAAIKASDQKETNNEEIREEENAPYLDDSTFSALLSIFLMIGTLAFVIYFFYL